MTVTKRAAEELVQIMKDDGKDITKDFLRVFVQGGGCSGFQYGLALSDEKTDTDKLFESNGVKVIVDPISIRYLEGAEVDFQDSPNKGFVIKNPNVKSTCGCGQSFEP